MKIIFLGGNGRFGKVFKKVSKMKNILYPNKKKLNILNINSIKKYLLKNKPKILIHAAGLSRPMNIHEKKIGESIKLNIIGTANVVHVCEELKIKVIYMSTSYVYEGLKGNYKETDPILPWNNYAWSKLGGECAVQMYKNSLILRACVTEKPFVHNKAFSNVKLNFIFHDELVKIIVKLFNKKGIYNVGGKTQTVYDFAKKYNPNIKKIKSVGQMPLNPSISLSKINKIK